MKRFLIFLVGASTLCAAALAAPVSAARGSDAEAKQAAPAQFVGADKCAACHEELSKTFATNPHSKMAHGDASRVTCESCHGPGSEHVADGDVTTIFDPVKASAKDLNAKCLTCHAGAHPDFLHSPHGKGNLSCISCHSIHLGKGDSLLIASQPAVCYQCHTDVKSAFGIEFHHPIEEGRVKCSDCHDVHGTIESSSNAKAIAAQNLICTKCHTDQRGPFTYEHAVVKTEGCLSCHAPHGSQNARLLKMTSVNALCNQCHGPVATATARGMNSTPAQPTPCTNCHTTIHGSNLSADLLK